MAQEDKGKVVFIYRLVANITLAIFGIYLRPKLMRSCYISESELSVKQKFLGLAIINYIVKTLMAQMQKTIFRQPRKHYLRKNSLLLNEYCDNLVLNS